MENLFAVNDTVRVTNPGSTWRNHKGKVTDFTPASAVENKFVYTVELDNGRSRKFFEKNLELISKAEGPKPDLFGRKITVVQPSYPTPWSVTDRTIRDANGGIVLTAVNGEVAEKIKDLVNEANPGDDKPKVRFWVHELVGIDPDVWAQEPDGTQWFQAYPHGSLLRMGEYETVDRNAVEVTVENLPPGYMLSLR